MRRGFTLVELLIVMAIIAILSGLGLSAYSGAVQLGREGRTSAIVKKLDQLLMERYEEYRTRAVPIKMPSMVVISGQAVPVTPRISAAIRLYALRDLMRMEMPDRVTDVSDDAAALYIDGNSQQPFRMRRASSQIAYGRRAQRSTGSANWATVWTTENEGAECLYIIVSKMTDGDKSALDYFSKDEIGDTDADGMPEILDGWGQPIHFLRWAPGYVPQVGLDNGWGVQGVDDDNDGTDDNLTEAGWPGSDDIKPVTVQTRNYQVAPDQFDPIKADPRWSNNTAQKPFLLKPLIMSSGRDKKLDVALLLTASNGPFHYAATTPPNDPYFVPAAGQEQLGTPYDFDGDGPNWDDNITNHAEQ